MDTAVVVALVAATASLAVAVWNAFAVRANQRDLARLETLKSLGDARLDYEFEARKRLYTRLEPLLFQFIDAAQSARIRVGELARTARNGNLDEGHSWLDDPDEDYFLLSTAYRLLAPAGLFRIWQRELTLVDLALDPLIRFRYIVGRNLFLSFSDDFNLAGSAPALDYRPDEPSPGAGEAVHGRQGIYAGKMEAAADALLMREPGSDTLRLRTFGELEQALADDAHVARAVRPVLDLLVGFHPARRPVTWRILVAQVHYYTALLGVSREHGDDTLPALAELVHVPDGERKKYDWRQERERDVHDDGEALRTPFDVAERHVLRELGELVDLYRRL